MDFKMWCQVVTFLAVIRLCNKYSWLICCHHLADTAYKICSTPILADSGHHNMIKSWEQNHCYPHAVKKNKRLHKRMTMVASASICIFICFSHLLRAAPKHLISQSLIPLAPAPHIFLPSMSPISEADPFIQLKRQRKYTRLDSDWWLAVSSLP